mmetsp:Transcript_39573/g.80735  ORF Transcript_39573/g.80735 Transcript_39573/m.80735 type:complete len:201 (-) Transcript_39573:404-1006(-)
MCTIVPCRLVAHTDQMINTAACLSRAPVREEGSMSVVSPFASIKRPLPLAVDSNTRIAREIGTCDACPFCRDSCNDPFCSTCKDKKEGPGQIHPGNLEETYTMCEIQRHNHAGSAWLLAGDIIYDATSYVACHPGGAQSILRKSGGSSDCSKDMSFHSKGAIKIWKKNRVGRLRPCPGRMESGNESMQWQAPSEESCVIC